MDQNNVSRLPGRASSANDRESESLFVQERNRRRAWLGLEEEGPFSSSSSGGHSAKH